MKTIKQIAEDLGLPKQRVYRFIKRECISEAHQENGVMYYDDAAESLIKQDVQVCARQPLLAAYHMGDLHQMVIHYVCKMICRQLVGALV